MNNQQSSFIINKEYNSNIAATILKRYWWWTLLLIGFFGCLAFIYLRYTKPIFESTIILQLGEKDKGKDILEVENINTKDNSISSEIELLRSELLFNIALDKLNMNVSLFSKGTILTEEKYHQSTFNVQPFVLKDSALCNVPIWISLVGNKVKLRYQLHGKEYSLVQPPNSRITNSHFDIAFKVSDFKSFKKDNNQNDLYFTFNDRRTLLTRLIGNLEILALDEEAKTIRVEYQGYNPELCRDIANAVTQSFFNYDEESKRKSAENILTFIADQLDSISGELQVSKDSLTRFQRSSNMPDPEGIALNLTQNMDRFQDQLFEIEGELVTLKLVSSKLKDEPNRLEIYRLIPEMLGKSFESSLTKQIQDLHFMLERKEDLLFEVTEENSEVKSLNLRIQSKIQTIRKSVDAIRERLETNAAIVQKKIGGFEGDYFKLPEKKMEYTRLKSLQELNEKYYSLLTEKKVLYAISNAGYTSNNRILNEAVIASIPVSPNGNLVYLGFLFIGTILGFALLIWKYMTFNEIHSIEDLKQLLPEKVTMLGTIPLMKDSNEYSQLIVHEAPKSMLAESLRNIRSNLSFVNANAKVIAISSSVSGEGKTFVTLNLAGIIALSGKKTIILDLDLRKPKIHLGFNVPNNKGISNIIIKTVTLDECIQQSPIENLHFLTAGPIPPNPSELVLSDAFTETLEELKSRYDIVVIDNPPIGLLTDGVKILSNADVPIYIFKSNYSKRVFATRVKELFEMNQLQHINIILNGAMSYNNRGYGYGYGYGSYGYGYYEEPKKQSTKTPKK